MEVPSRHGTEFDIRARDLAEHHRRVAGEGEEEFCIRIERYPAQPAHVVLVAQTELDVVLGVKITGWTDEGHVLDPGYPVLIDAEVHSAERIEFVVSWRVLMAWVEVIPNACY